ncbi:MAG: TolC family protein [Vampirovibrionales bacterium]|nr:TolC family protein [Vampirovibrionales bacterium]
MTPRFKPLLANRPASKNYPAAIKALCLAAGFVFCALSAYAQAPLGAEPDAAVPVADFSAQAKAPEAEDVQTVEPLTTATPNTPTPVLSPLMQPLQIRLQKQAPLQVNLPMLLKLIDAQNLSVEQARIEKKIAGTRTLLSYSEFLPDVTLSYNHSRFQGGRQIFGNQIVQIIQTSVQPTLSVNWTLYPGGRTVYESLAARRRERAAIGQLSESWQGQLAQAAILYHQWVGSLLQERVAQVAVNETMAQEQINQARYDAGVGTKLELMQAQTQRAQSERELLRVQSQTMQLEQSVLAATNTDANAYLRPEDLPEIPFNAPVSSQQLLRLQTKLFEQLPPLPQLLAYAYDKNPSLKRLLAEKKALQADLGATRSDILPSVTLSAYIGGAGPSLDNLALQRFGGVQVQANLLDNLGTSLPLRIHEKALLVRKKLAEAEAATRDLENTLTQAYLQAIEAEKSIEVGTVQLASAQEALRLANARVKAGVGIQLDALSAQTQLGVARRSLIDAIIQQNIAHIRLMQALGEVTPESLVSGFTRSQATKS